MSIVSTPEHLTLLLDNGGMERQFFKDDNSADTSSQYMAGRSGSVSDFIWVPASKKVTITKSSTGSAFSVVEDEVAGTGSEYKIVHDFKLADGGYTYVIHAFNDTDNFYNLKFSKTGYIYFTWYYNGSYGLGDSTTFTYDMGNTYHVEIEKVGSAFTVTVSWSGTSSGSTVFTTTDSKLTNGRAGFGAEGDGGDLSAEFYGLTVYPPVAFVDTFVEDNGRYACVSGASVTVSDGALSVTSLSSYGHGRLKSYKFLSGGHKTNLTLPATCATGEFLAYVFNNTGANVQSGFRIGVVRQADGTWKDTYDSGTGFVTGSTVPGLADGAAFTIEVDYSHDTGTCWYYIYLSGGFRPAAATRKFSATVQGAQFYASWQNYVTGTRTFTVDALEIRANSVLGFTNIPQGSGFKPMLRGDAQRGEFYDGSSTITATRIYQDFNHDTTAEWINKYRTFTIDPNTGTASSNSTNGLFQLDSPALGEGYYRYRCRHVLSATQYWVLLFGWDGTSNGTGTPFNCYGVRTTGSSTQVSLRKWDGSGTQTQIAEAYLPAAAATYIFLDVCMFWNPATGAITVKVYSPTGALLATVNGTDTTIQSGYAGFYASSTAGSAYAMSLLIDALATSSATGSLITIGGVPHGALYDVAGGAYFDFVPEVDPQHVIFSVNATCPATPSAEMTYENITDASVITAPWGAKGKAIVATSSGRFNRQRLTLDGDDVSDMIRIGVRRTDPSTDNQPAVFLDTACTVFVKPATISPNLGLLTPGLVRGWGEEVCLNFDIIEECMGRADHLKERSAGHGIILDHKFDVSTADADAIGDNLKKLIMMY